MAFHIPPQPWDERLRLEALHRLNILDTLPEEMFDSIVTLAADICGTPIGFVSLIDSGRQWFKAKVGMDVAQTPRDQAFCSHAILQPDQLMMVEDTHNDPRFRHNPLVASAGVRFYAGAPVLTSDGQPVGTVCVIDITPRQLSEWQTRALKTLAAQTSALLQLRELRQLHLMREMQAQKLQHQVVEALSNDGPLNLGFQQNQRVSSIGQMAIGVVHDFNNVLQTINGSFQLVQRHAENSEQVRRWAMSGLEAVTRGAKLASQLMAFSRAKIPDAKPFDAVDTINGMRELLARALGPQVALQFNLEEESVNVSGDPTQLKAAILNLVINARDAIRGVGKVGVLTRLTAVSGDDELVDGDYLLVEVKNDGPGMAPDVAARAFEPFFTTKQGGKDAGLGLTQVYGFVKRAGGVARIESCPDAGSTVRLWLKKSTTRDVDQQSSAAAANWTEQYGASLLLVDDDDELRTMLSALLSEAGYGVRAACNGVAALETAAEERPEVAIIDCAMAVMGGRELADRLRDIQFELPIVFITGHADVSGAYSNLPDHTMVLRKPFLLEDLLGAIRHVSAKTGKSKAALIGG